MTAPNQSTVKFWRLLLHYVVWIANKFGVVHPEWTWSNAILQHDSELTISIAYQFLITSEKMTNCREAILTVVQRHFPYFDNAILRKQYGILNYLCRLWFVHDLVYFCSWFCYLVKIPRISRLKSSRSSVLQVRNGAFPSISDVSLWSWTNCRMKHSRHGRARFVRSLISIDCQSILHVYCRNPCSGHAPKCFHLKFS